MLRERDDAQILAGGQTLIPVMKQRLASPAAIVDLKRVPGLAAITADAHFIDIGALATHAAVAASPLVRRAIPALADLADGIGDPQVRNRGTLGGSIANNDPAADYPAALVALAATIHTSEREIAADAFFTGHFETDLVPGEIRHRRAPAGAAPRRLCQISEPRFALRPRRRLRRGGHARGTRRRDRGGADLAVFSAADRGGLKRRMPRLPRQSRRFMARRAVAKALA